MDKQRLKSTLYNYEVRIAAVITRGVLTRASKRDTMLKVRHELLRVKLDSLEQNKMWQFATSFYRHCVAGAGRETDIQKRADKLYAVLRGDVQLLEHQKNLIADSVEFRKKHQELMDVLSSESNFFYCTAHKNPAEGHAAYQDRIYYRKNGQLTPEEEEFAFSQKLMAVEEVVLGPVWLCTRRNCRHRLIPISFESAKNGDFRGETYSHKISYEEEQYNDYKDRLKMFVQMKKVYQNVDGVDVPDQMKLDVRRTYSLCRAWKNRIKKPGS